MKPAREKGETFGEYLARLEAWSGTDEGVAWAAASERAEAAERRAEDARWMRDEVGVPQEIAAVLLSESGPSLTEPMAAVRSLAPREYLVFLAGRVGTGKSVAACWAATRPCVSSALFVRSVRLARWARYDDDEVDRLLSPKVLVIDDLGSEFNDERGSFWTLFEEVAVTRAENHLLTVVTTNLLVDDVRARYHFERVAERVRSLGAFIQFDGESLRGRRVA